jgi:hypothetical protein
MRSRLSILSIFGLVFAAVPLLIGTVIAKTTVLTCDRRILPQGQCQIDRSTLLLPWVKTTERMALTEINKAELVDESDNYQVILRSRQGKAIELFKNAEGPGDFPATAASLNQYLNDPSKPLIIARSGDDREAIVILLIGCGVGLGAAWFTRKPKPL